ncbi:hypothetical protein [Nocardia australiensis]|uniref:hypothetical protein n=1 Tax=Nocardia australiensis TaxID=2887191 RepID=UPI001D13DC60|nr:hypothetical protein [Nocardia australiensis]
MSTPTTAWQAGTEAAAATDDVSRRSGISPSEHRRSGYRRGAALTAAALTTMAATVVFAPATYAVTTDRSAMQNAAATAAVGKLTTGPGLDAAFPDDFTTMLGYRPGIVNGLMANPNGDCSSPVTLPAEFDTACKAHDLGYDLLRYADRHNAPLGPWARQALDTTLGQHMHEACATREDPFSRTRCDTMASIATTFVDLNSRRQDYGPPVVETLTVTTASENARSFGGWLWLMIGGGLVGLAGAVAGVFPVIRRSADRTRARRTRAAVPTTNHAEALGIPR